MMGKFMAMGFGKYRHHQIINHGFMEIRIHGAWSGNLYQCFFLMLPDRVPPSPVTCPGNILNLFLFCSKSKYFLKCSFFTHLSNKEVQLSIFGGPKTQESTTVKSIFIFLMFWGPSFHPGPFALLTLGSPLIPFLLHFMTSAWLKIGWE